MKLLTLAIAASLIAGQVSALSCMRPDAQISYLRAAQSPDTYYVLYGTLGFDAALLPEGVENRPREPAPIAAQFRGASLTTQGFTNAYSGTVTLQPTCVGPWCGSHDPGVKALMFARVDGGEIIIEAGPCRGSIFAEPNDAVLQQMTACMNGNCN